MTLAHALVIVGGALDVVAVACLVTAVVVGRRAHGRVKDYNRSTALLHFAIGLCGVAAVLGAVGAAVSLCALLLLTHS